MTAYRVYAIDRDGLVVRARLLEARADEEAISAAAGFGWPRWQLWRGTRLVRESAAADGNTRPGSLLTEPGGS